MYLHHLANAIDTSHRRYIAQEIEIEFLVKGRIDRLIGPDHEQRITVRRRTHHGIRRDIAASTWPVSMMNCCPRRSDSHWAMRRTSTSMAWPAGKSNEHMHRPHRIRLRPCHGR